MNSFDRWPLLTPPPSVHTLTGDNLCNQWDVVETAACDFWGNIRKYLWLLPCSLLSLVFWGKPSHHMMKTLKQSVEGPVGLGAVVSYQQRALWERIILQADPRAPASSAVCSPGNIAVSWETLSQDHQLRRFWIPDPQKLCCKPLSFGLTYTATNN